MHWIISAKKVKINHTVDTLLISKYCQSRSSFHVPHLSVGRWAATRILPSLFLFPSGVGGYFLPHRRRRFRLMGTRHWFDWGRGPACWPILHKLNGKTMSNSVISVISRFLEEYTTTTPNKLKVVDAYLLYILLTGALQFLYCLLVGTFPFNSFLSGFISCVGAFILAGKYLFS